MSTNTNKAALSYTPRGGGDVSGKGASKPKPKPRGGGDVSGKGASKRKPKNR